jgi:hypothetical protein
MDRASDGGRPEPEWSSRVREYGPGHPLVFSHIPKTAGTSLRFALRQALEPDVVVGSIDVSLYGGYFDPADLRGAVRAMACLGPGDLPADATLVAAHIAPSTTMARYPGADHITFLRAPQVRFMSQWLHTRTVSDYELRQWGRSAEMFRATRAPLREYLRNRMVAPNVDNTITRYLLWPHPLVPQTDFIDAAHDDEVYGAALERLSSFAHVDVVENANFMAGLGAWLGRDLPSARLNERSSALVRRRPDLTAELDADTSELLRHRMRLDDRLWSHVAGITLPDADPAALLASTIDGAMERYRTMLAEPAPKQPVAHVVVDGLYRIGAGLKPRRRVRSAR